MKQLKNEISAVLSVFEKKAHQRLIKVRNEEISVFTKKVEEKTVCHGTLAVEIKKMESELSGSCTTQASGWEER